MRNERGIEAVYRTGTRQFNNLLGDITYSLQIFLWGIAERMCKINQYYIIPIFHYINLVVDHMTVYTWFAL